MSSLGNDCGFRPTGGANTVLPTHTPGPTAVPSSILTCCLMKHQGTPRCLLLKQQPLLSHSFCVMPLKPQLMRWLGATSQVPGGNRDKWARGHSARDALCLPGDLTVRITAGSVNPQTVTVTCTHQALDGRMTGRMTGTGTSEGRRCRSELRV